MRNIKFSEKNISGRRLHTHTKWFWIAVLCAMSLGSSAWAVRGRPHLDTTLGYNVLLSDNDTLLRGMSLSFDGGDPFGTTTPTLPSQAQLNALATDYGLNTVHLYLEADTDGYSDGNHNAIGYNATLCDTLVSRCAAANLYLIVTIGCNNHNGQMDLAWSTAFWNYYGPRYKDDTHVIYEAHNEPAGWTPSNWVQSDWDNQISMYNTIRGHAPNTFILLGSFMGFSGDITWGENYLSNNGVSWSNAGFAYHGYESLAGIEANIDRMSANTSYPALLCTEFGIDETINSDYNSMCESHYNGWMQFQWLGANNADLLDFKHKIDAAGTIWTPDNASCNWPTKGTRSIPDGSTIGLFDRGQDKFLTATSANSNNLRAEASTYTASADDAFIIEDLGTGLVALKRASDSKYVRTTSETDSLTASQSSVGNNEMFEFLRLDNDDIALRAYGGGGHLVKSSSAGTTLVPDGDSGSILDSKYVILTSPGGKPAPISSPYHGTPAIIPGVIEAEDFDLGGEGLAYHDTSVGNVGGCSRLTDSVDIASCNEGGCMIGDMDYSEWVEYTVDVTVSGQYMMDIRVATPYPAESLHMEFDGVDVTGNLPVPNTGNWQIFTDLTVLVSLNAGIQPMRFVNDGGIYNINKFTLTRIGGDCDIDGDDKVDNVDFAIFGQNWQDTSCGTCGDADFTDDGNVNINDLYLLAENWLNDYSLMGHWALDGDATDNSYYEGDGTVYGTPAWDATEHIGGSMIFDGTNDYIEIQDYTGISGSNSRTIAAWINADATAAGVIVNWGSLVDGGKWRFLLSNGALRVSVQGSGKNGTTDLRGAGWHHIAAVFENDGTPDVNDIKFYIDGAEDATDAATPMPINTTSNQNVSIGAALNGATPSQYFKGQIDDVRIYNRALDVTEIQILADMGH